MQTSIKRADIIGHICLFLALLSALIGQSYVLKPLESVQVVFNFVTLLSLFLMAVFAWPKFSRPVLVPILRSHWITVLYLASLLILTFAIQDNDPQSLPIPVAYAASIIGGFVLAPLVLLNNPSLYLSFLATCSLLSAFCGLSALASVVGIDSVGAVTFSVKDAASYNFLGFQATGGFLEHALSLGTQSFLGIMVCYLWYFQTSSSKQRAIAIGCGVICFLGMLVSQGRGAWLAAGAALAVMAVFHKRRILNLLLLLVIAPLVWIGIGKAEDLIAPNSTLGRALRIQMGTSSRDVLWDEGVHIMSQKPWTGWGITSPGQFSAIIEEETLGERGAHVGTAGFHNSFIDSGVAYGFLVGGMYATIFVVTLWRCTRFRQPMREWRCLAAITVGSVISIVFVSYNIGGLRLTSVMISILLGMSFADPALIGIRKSALAPLKNQNGNTKSRVRVSVA